LNRASTTLQNLQKAEDQNADSGIAASTPVATAKTTTATASTATSAPAVTWTLDSLNNAEWYENIGKGQLPVYARAHVMLNNAHASPGAIDGMSGKNTLKAIASFQQMNGLSPTG
ncbi:peptidoglycan-binding protein, partial [Acinetobacter baumannii]